MATVTDAGATTADTTNLDVYPSASFTPAAGDLLVVLISSTGTVQDPGSIIVSANGVSSMTLVARSVSNTDTHSQYIYVADQLVGSSPTAMTLSWDCTGDTATGGIVMVARVAGMAKTGAAAIRQFAKVDNGAGGTTPVFTFPGACLTDNPTLAVLGKFGTAAYASPPAGWTKITDAFYSSPNQGGTYIYRDSGFTDSVLTWGGNEAVHGGVALELDASSSGGSANVNSFAATATAGALAPSLSAGVTVSAVPATATASSPAPVVDTAGNYNVDSEVASATAGALAPTVTAGASVSVAPGAATATSMAPTPTVTVVGVQNASVAVPLIVMQARGERPTVDATALTYHFEPPTFEAPMQTKVRPLNYYRLTYAMSVVRVNGSFTSVRHPNTDLLNAAGVEGEDYFLGGRVYEVSAAVATALAAAGYVIGIPAPDPSGYGLGGYGSGPYGDPTVPAPGGTDPNGYGLGAYGSGPYGE